MIHITQFEPELAAELPETHALLAGANLNVHDSVSRVTLHGTRGPLGGARGDSDIDLGLVVSTKRLSDAPDAAELLGAVVRTALENWRSHIEADLAAIFDKTGCGLRCLDVREFDPEACPATIDCMGLFKIQKGFDGFVSGPAVDCSKMYPLMTIWRNPQ